jgi:endo-1,3(4)-beta-glucanase
VALVNQCTTGKSDIQQHCLPENQMKDAEAYLNLLRENTAYPKTPKVEFDYQYKDNDEENKALITFDWDAQELQTHNASDSVDSDLLMFSLPHHQEQLEQGEEEDAKTKTLDEFCLRSFHGMSCIIQGNSWTIVEKLGRPQSFIAARPPASWAIPDLAKALAVDIHYLLSDNLMRGAADTYFSGKLMARLGRVIEIAMELKDLAAGNGAQDKYYDADPDEYALSVQAAKKATLPTDEEVQAAIDQIKLGVVIWVNGKGEAPYVYDRSWGGMINCGCNYKGKGDKGTCANSYPHCPALTDVNVDFGNGYYNDHHFHYGYHIYAAAVAAKHDHDWGRTHFDDILLYIRDIANPSAEDKYFTQFRQKDWFLGSSWASGIVSGENSPHGRNEESSSEAIAAYEAMALYGAVMVRQDFVWIDLVSASDPF